MEQRNWSTVGPSQFIVHTKDVSYLGDHKSVGGVGDVKAEKDDDDDDDSFEIYASVGAQSAMGVGGGKRC
jgi:hypothetical protein